MKSRISRSGWTSTTNSSSDGIRPIITSAPINRLPSSPQMNIIETGLNAIRLPSVTNVLDEYTPLTCFELLYTVPESGEMGLSMRKAACGRLSRKRNSYQSVERDGDFFVYPEEWWLYDFKDFREYAILDTPFSAIASPPSSKKP